MRISDWSSDVCSSDLAHVDDLLVVGDRLQVIGVGGIGAARMQLDETVEGVDRLVVGILLIERVGGHELGLGGPFGVGMLALDLVEQRSEEHTSELQSLMRISYAVFCLKKKKDANT